MSFCNKKMTINIEEGTSIMSYKEDILRDPQTGYELAFRIYEVEKPKAIVKCIHGMEEHQGRYQGFAEFLQKNGYTVVTADLRGHGPNAQKLSHIADKRGDKLLIHDEELFLEYIKEKYPNVPLILFGHSMGTIIARRVLANHSKEYQKVVLSGYPNPQAIGSIGAALSAFIGVFKKRTGYSKLLTSMVLGPFVKAIDNAKSPLEWLSYNEANQEYYANDPLCGAEFTIGSYNALFHMVGDISKAKLYKDVKEDLPIYLISGEDDPCTGGEKGRKASITVLEKAGFKCLKVDTLNHMRHEILNETDKEKVQQMILDFIEA